MIKRNNTKTFASRSKNEWESSVLSADISDDIEMQQGVAVSMSLGYNTISP